MQLTDYHVKYFAHELACHLPSDGAEKLAGAVGSAWVEVPSLCERGHDDYSLQVENLTQNPLEPVRQVLDME